MEDKNENIIREGLIIISEFLEFMNKINKKTENPDTQFIFYHLIERITREDIDRFMLLYEKHEFKNCAWNDKEKYKICDRIVTEIFSKLKSFRKTVKKDTFGNITEV